MSLLTPIVCFFLIFRYVRSGISYYPLSDDFIDVANQGNPIPEIPLEHLPTPFFVPSGGPGATSPGYFLSQGIEGISVYEDFITGGESYGRSEHLLDFWFRVHNSSVPPVPRDLFMNLVKVSDLNRRDINIYQLELQIPSNNEKRPNIRVLRTIFHESDPSFLIPSENIFQIADDLEMDQWHRITVILEETPNPVPNNDDLFTFDTAIWVNQKPVYFESQFNFTGPNLNISEYISDGLVHFLVSDYEPIQNGFDGDIAKLYIFGETPKSELRTKLPAFWTCTNIPDCDICVDISTGFDTCTQCRDGYIWKNNACQQCDAGSYYLPDNGGICVTCQEAISDCIVCNQNPPKNSQTPVTCVICEPGYYSQIPSATSCETCSGMIDNCKQCLPDISSSTGLQCTMCNDPYYLILNSTTNEYICIEDCPERYFHNDLGIHTCQICENAVNLLDTHCSVCQTVPGDCEECFYPDPLDGYHYIYDPDINTCRCADGKFGYLDTCVDVCPPDYSINVFSSFVCDHCQSNFDYCKVFEVMNTDPDYQGILLNFSLTANETLLKDMQLFGFVEDFVQVIEEAAANFTIEMAKIMAEAYALKLRFLNETSVMKRVIDRLAADLYLHLFAFEDYVVPEAYENVQNLYFQKLVNDEQDVELSEILSDLADLDAKDIEHDVKLVELETTNQFLESELDDRKSEKNALVDGNVIQDVRMDTIEKDDLFLFNETENRKVEIGILENKDDELKAMLDEVEADLIDGEVLFENQDISFGAKLENGTEVDISANHDSLDAIETKYNEKFKITKTKFGDYEIMHDQEISEFQTPNGEFHKEVRANITKISKLLNDFITKKTNPMKERIVLLSGDHENDDGNMHAKLDDVVDSKWTLKGALQQSITATGVWFAVTMIIIMLVMLCVVIFVVVIYRRKKTELIVEERLDDQELKNVK